MPNIFDQDEKLTMTQMMITNKDIHNIRKQFKINDLAEESLPLFIDYINSTSEIFLYYKDFGSVMDGFDENDFLIIIQSPGQKKMILENSEIILIDSSIAKGLLLTTIICRDHMK
ncbi:hypothetical protein BLA29_012272 [Euroglyphus maynei]|uniref:Uncharacterized protein n=1 Tax=Euroglyphus maynei TaxID=6958 RepID=A0A1Y3ATJ8_EURMA|nr:hypothetical protein BLA29_012272 [Euroglyphus maynei]